MTQSVRHQDASRIRFWLAAVALVVGEVTVGVAVGTVPAGADPIADCSTTSGVIVVVDFSDWGGAIERGCDSTLTTGYDALHAAGFSTAGDDEDGPAFVCRIDDDPPPSQDACITTPPASAYWSNWHADAGQNTWSYSQQGAMSYHPPPGSVDAWVFGAANASGTGEPSFPPSAVRATNTSPIGPGPTTSTTTAPIAPSTTAVAAHAPPGTGSTATVAARTAGRGPAAGENAPVLPPTRRTAAPGSVTTTTSEADAQAGGAGHTIAGSRHATSVGSGDGTDGTDRTNSRDAGQSGGGLRIVTASPAVSGHGSSSGSPLLFVAGTAVVGALGGVGVLIAWRRRRTA